MAGRFSVAVEFRGIDNVSRPIAKMQANITRFTRSINLSVRASNKLINGMMHSMMMFGMQATLAIGGIAAAIGLFLNSFSKIENAEAAFQPILGSLTKAKELVDALNNTAATTPFQFENLADAAKQLLPVMDGNIKDIIGTIRMLGDTAGGNIVRFQSIARGFTKALLKGKVDLEALNIIGEAGVPIFSELAKSMGTTTQALFKLIRTGKVTQDDLIRSFKTMTSEGGIFFNGMAIASQTLAGRFSTMRDVVIQASAAIGSAMAPSIKKLITETIASAFELKKWAEVNKKAIGDKFKEYVDNIKAFAIAVFNARESIIFWTKWIFRAVVAIKAMNLVLTLLSFVKVIAGIFGVGTASTATSTAVVANNTRIIASNVAVAASYGGVSRAAAMSGSFQQAGKFFPGGIQGKLRQGGNVARGASVAATARLGFGASMLKMSKGLLGIPRAILAFVGPLGVVVGAISLIAYSINNIFGQLKAADEQKAQLIHDRALNPSENITANLTEEEKSRLSAQDRVALGLPPASSSASATVTIRDETGRAELFNSSLSGRGSGIRLLPSGAF